MASFKNLPFESEEAINFHNEEIDLALSDQDKTSAWIKSAILQEGRKLGNLNFIFCSDTYLHKINVDYLDHDTLTDVITFPYSDTHIEGDIFISIDRITENAKSFAVSVDDELNRVIIHGVLHLMGYGDKSAEDKHQMTLKENIYLCLLKGMS
ncbi:MAG: putative rRNA maturation factor [Saprospiraceae bacterium]|jgi:probable rRNA maturation factor